MSQDLGRIETDPVESGVGEGIAIFELSLIVGADQLTRDSKITSG